MNRAVTPADYTAVSVFNPVTGQAFDVYNLSAAAATRAIDNYTFVDPARKNQFNSYSTDFRARLSKGVAEGEAADGDFQFFTESVFVGAGAGPGVAVGGPPAA